MTMEEDELRRAIWSAWLDGDSLSSIHNYDAPSVSIRTISRILGEPAPDSMKDDPRFQGRRYLWISCSGVVSSTTGHDCPLAILRHPRKIKRSAMTKALAWISNDLKISHPGGRISPHVLERFGIDDADLVERLILVKGFPAWSFDEDGTTTRLTRENLTGHTAQEFV